MRGQRGLPLAMRRRDGESPPAFGLSHRSWEGAGCAIHQLIGSLVDNDVLKVSRVSQDGVRMRVSAGASRVRREKRLEKLLAEAQQQVDEPQGRRCGSGNRG